MKIEKPPRGEVKSVPEKCPHCHASVEKDSIEYSGVAALTILDETKFKEGLREAKSYLEIRLFRCGACNYLMMFER